MRRDELLEKLLLKFLSDIEVIHMSQNMQIYFLFHVSVILFFQKFASKGLLKFYL